MNDLEKLIDAMITLKALNDTENPRLHKILAIFHKYGLTSLSGLAMLKELEEIAKEGEI